MRKSEILLDAIGKIDDELIANAGKVKDKSRIKIWLRCGALAACLALVVGVCSVAGWFAPNERLPELPMLTISENLGAMGFEGYMAYDISELVSANPWSERAKISTLPVYKNQISYNLDLIISGADFDAMEDFLIETADRLGMDTSTLTITDDAPSAEEQEYITEKFARTGEEVPEGYFNPRRLIAKQDGIEIEVDTSMTATITFDPAISLPDDLNFAFDASYDDITAVAEYIKKEYKEFISMDNPAINIYGGDYTIYLDRIYWLEYYNSVGNLTDRIINYNFNRVAFYSESSSGKLFMARIYNPDLSDKLGDYPIISAKEAKKLLLNGNYVTSVPYDLPGKEYIKKVELIYRTDVHDEYFIPYYRFYIELPEAERDGGMKTYGAYYVPAVREEYIENMPLWNGSFN